MDHGGFGSDDNMVGLVVYGNGLATAGAKFPGAASSVQVAPTVLKLLGLDYKKLKAVQIEGTTPLPGLAYDVDGKKKKKN